MCVFRHHDKEVPMYFLIREFYRKNEQERAFFFLLFPGYDLQYQIWVL